MTTITAIRRLDRPVSRNLSSLVPVFRYLKPYRLRVAGALVALVVAAGTVLALGTGLRYLVDAGFDSASDARVLDRAVIILLGCVVLLAVATYMRFFLVSWIGERVVADLRRDVFKQVIKLSPAFYELTSTSEIQSRLTTDTTVLQVVVGSTLSIALRNSLLLVGGLIMLVITSPKLAGVVVLALPLILVPMLVFGRRVRRLSRVAQDRVADLASYSNEALSSIRTVQAFNHEEVDKRRFRTNVEEAFDAAIERTSARAVLTALVMLLAFGAISAVLWVGGHAVLRGDMTGGQLSAFLFYAIVTAGASGAISEVLGDLQRAAGATERLVELLQTEPEIAAIDNPDPLPERISGALTFEKVTFRYPSRPETSALDELSFSIAPGETVAIVGPSGAGKTTIFQLLLRFYDPQSGKITLDGVDLQRADPAAARAQVGLVPQEPVIFSADAWENIRYGRPDATDEEVLAAAEAAAAREFLEGLPKGLNSYLGEKGVRLSGGQRQRIAIARAVLRDPPVLLLDEATSSLDAESERLVQQALERLMVGRTTLIIAHRLATVLKADRILVLDRGRLVASGSHEELVAEEDSLYARLAALQFDVEGQRGDLLARGEVVNL